MPVIEGKGKKKIANEQRNNSIFFLFNTKFSEWVQKFKGFREVSGRNVPNCLQDSILVNTFVVQFTINLFYDDTK